MLTRLVAKNFKLFEKVEVELGERVVFVGPNNSGKTSALQALALWNVGVRRWVERRGAGNVPKERAGVTINRRDLIAVPIPAANLLWRDLHVREGYREDGKSKTRNVLIEVDVEGIDGGKVWSTKLEFDYANEESFYCRSRAGHDGARLEVPTEAAAVRLAYLPPMSGLASNERRLDEGAIDVLIGEGRTAEVLRNLCWRVFERHDESWPKLDRWMKSLFGIQLEEPRYLRERGEIVMSFKGRGDAVLDLSASGRGQQQTLLLLAHMSANPGAVLLLDEPDAHLEVLRQRQIYQVLTEAASETGSQIIAASHSEVILDEAADRDTVVAFIGKPHRIDDRGSQVLKALKEIGFVEYLQAEEAGWVLYLEGSTDLAILRAFANLLNHRAKQYLERPFIRYVGNQPRQAHHHFFGLREAKPDLVGIAIYDRLTQELQRRAGLEEAMWARREIENYLCTRSTLLRYAEAQGRERHGELFGLSWRDAMAEAIDEVAGALATLGRPDPWSADLKASEEALTPIFEKFYRKVGLPNLMSKTDFHTLAPLVLRDELSAEVSAKLDLIVQVASQAVGATLPGQ